MAFRSLAAVALLTLLSSCGDGVTPRDGLNRVAGKPVLTIQLDGDDPSASYGLLQRSGEPLRFNVGHGRYGIPVPEAGFRKG